MSQHKNLAYSYLKTFIKLIKIDLFLTMIYHIVKLAEDIILHIM